MGIFTDYGRYVKAREFKKFCNSGGGLWFAFGSGGKGWNIEDMPKAPPCNTRQNSDQNNDETEPTPDEQEAISGQKYRPCPCGCGCVIEVPVTSWGTEDGDWMTIPTFTYTLPVMMILSTTRTDESVSYIAEHPLCMQLNPEGKAEMYFAYDAERDPLFVSEDTRISARQILKAYHDGYDAGAYAIVFRDYYLTNGRDDGDLSEIPATRSVGKEADDDTERGFCLDLSGLRHGLIQFGSVSSADDPRLGEKPGSKKQVLNDDGTPKTEIRLDKDGNIVLDAEGNAIFDAVYTDWSSAELQERKTSRYNGLKGQPYLVLTDTVRARSNDRRNRPSTETETSGSTTGKDNKPVEYGSVYEDKNAARYLNGYDTNGLPFAMPLTDMERARNYPIFPVCYLDDLNDTENDYCKPMYYVNGTYYGKRVMKSDGYEYSEEIAVPEYSDTEAYQAFQRRRHRWVLSGWYNAFGFLGMVKGSAELVCEAEKEAADTFLYGGRFWRLATDSMFPTYVILRVNLNPFGLSQYPEVDRALNVRQIGVYHMRDGSASEDVSVMRSEDYILNIGQAIPSGTGKAGTIEPENFEFVMNDYMISAQRVANQIDRYGYIIGF